MDEKHSEKLLHYCIDFLNSYLERKSHCKGFSMAMYKLLCYSKATKGPVFAFKESNTDMEESEHDKTILQEVKVFSFVWEQLLS